MLNRIKNENLGDLSRPDLLFQMSYQVDENCTFGMMGHASILEIKHQMDQAIALVKYAISIEKNTIVKADMHFYLASFLKKNSNLDEAKKACEDGVKLNPEDPRFNTLLTELHK